MPDRSDNPYPLSHPQPIAARGRGETEAGGGATSDARRPPLDDLRFPGCRPVRLTRDGLDDFEDQIEYWDARSRIAWIVADGPSSIHEGTTRQLTRIAERLALISGAPIATLGSVGLVERSADGQSVRLMQADEILYLHPGRVRLPDGNLVMGEHDLPDIVLEVDYSTDIRPGKLRVYERWGFPEVWAMVPEGRSRRRAAGLTISRLGADGRYHDADASTALRGWTAAEIHAALAEPAPSAHAARVLMRLGRALGAQAGTRAEDLPLVRALTAEARAAGYREGHAAGYRGEHAAGRREGFVAAIESVLWARGISIGGSLPGGPAPFGDASRDAVVAAAVACADAADFWRRLDVTPPTA